MRNMYTVFDLDNKKIGLAPATTEFNKVNFIPKFPFLP